jgi:hypothetical protein
MNASSASKEAIPPSSPMPRPEADVQASVPWLLVLYLYVSLSYGMLYMLWVKHGSRGHKVATTTTGTTGCFTGFYMFHPLSTVSISPFEAGWSRAAGVANVSGTSGAIAEPRTCRLGAESLDTDSWNLLGSWWKLGFRTNTHTCSETSFRTLCFETTPVLTFKSRAWSIVCARLVFQIWHIRNQQLGLSCARTKEQLQPETQQRRGACWQTLRGIGLQRNLPGVSMRCMRSVWFIYIYVYISHTETNMQKTPRKIWTMIIFFPGGKKFVHSMANWPHGEHVGYTKSGFRRWSCRRWRRGVGRKLSENGTEWNRVSCNP